MGRAALLISRVLLALLLVFGIFWICSDDERWMHIVTLCISVVASGIVVFSASRANQILAALLMCIIVAVSFGVDWYFWSLVWEKGYPWPYPSIPTGVAFIGSIAGFVSQVSEVSAAISVILAIALMSFRCLTYRSRDGRAQAPAADR